VRNTALYDCVIVDLTLFKLYLFILLMTPYDVMCMSEFVLFNNAIILVLLFGKTVKLLLSSMIQLKKQRTV